jgi:hypothetical protein
VASYLPRDFHGSRPHLSNEYLLAVKHGTDSELIAFDSELSYFDNDNVHLACQKYKECCKACLQDSSNDFTDSDGSHDCHLADDSAHLPLSSMTTQSFFSPDVG